jgi:Flp pilus assembly protein TadG
MSNAPICNLIKDTRGAALVEFVFAAPMLFLFLAGMLELGHFMWYYQAVSDGSRAAARYLSRVESPCDLDELDRAAALAATRTSDWSGTPLFADWPAAAGDLGTNFQISVSQCSAGALSGELITFVVSYQYNDPIGLLSFFGESGGFWLNGVHEEVHIGA